MRQKSRNAVAFQAMVIKEFRANARWMLLGFVVTALGLMLGVASEIRNASSLISMYSGYGTCTVLAGLLLGVTAMIGESRGDALGFLLHRPVGRSIMFAGKVTAGLILYLGAVFVPAAILALWAMSPGHLVAPFDVLLLRGPLMDLLSGTVFFLAGFLGAMREARWYATRWVAIGAAGVMLFLVMTVPDFGTALAIWFLTFVVCGVAAWGTFIAAGHYEQQPMVARLATTLSVGVGLAAVASLTAGNTISWLGDWLGSPSENIAPSTSVNLELTRSGPVRVERLGDVVVSLTDMNGIAMDTATFNRLDDSIRSDGLRLDKRPLSRNDGAYREAGDAFWRMPLMNYGTQVNWYFVRRTGLVVGYDQRTRRQVAWVSPSGFATVDLRPNDRFEGRLENSEGMLLFSVSGQPSRGAFLVFPTGVYTVNARTRTLAKVFSPARADTVITAESSQDGALLVATAEAAHLLRPDGSRATIRHPESDLTLMTLYRINTADANAMYVRYRGRVQANSNDPRRWAFTKIAPDGTSQDHYSIPPDPRPPVGSARLSTEASNVLVPAILHVTGVALTGVDDYGRSFNHAAWFFPVLMLFSLLSCAINIIMARRHAFSVSRQLLWAVMGLALGPIAVALMLALIEWPTLEKCPACGRKRVVIREKCEHCASTFVPPQADGTEILEFSHSSAR